MYSNVSSDENPRFAQCTELKNSSWEIQDPYGILIFASKSSCALFSSSLIHCHQESVKMWPVLECMFKIHFGISLVCFRSWWSFPPGYLTVLQPFAVLALFVGVASQQVFQVLILLEKQSCHVDLDEYYFLLHHKARLRKLVGPCLGACGEIVALRLPLGCTHWNI